MKKYIIFLLFYSFCNNNLFANENIINSISVDGMQRIDEETVISYADVSKGDVYTEEIGNNILKVFLKLIYSQIFKFHLKIIS